MSVVALSDATPESSFGGKAAALAKARRAGLPVPDGFAIDWTAVRAIAEWCAEWCAPPARPREAGRMPAPLQDALRAFRACGERVAVRSSAIGEDSLDASFAGQHATILNVTTVDAFLDAIRTIHDSAHADGVVEYRARMGVSGERRIAVVVQRMVDAEVAGVLFTRDPVTGAKQQVIESAWGLGEAVVAGLVTPDRFRIGSEGRVIERTAGAKEIAIRFAPDGGTAETPVDPLDVNRYSLTDEQLAELHALALRCERFFGGPQDLEWAIAGEELFLLQSRPVTRVAEEGLAPRRFAGLALAALLAPLNSTIIAVALPSIALAFDASSAVVTRWLVTGYLVVSIVAQSPAGKVADLWGYSRVLTLGRTLFAVGAIVAAFSPQLEILGAGRVLMALGGAFSIPTVFAQLRNSVPAGSRGRVFGIFGAIMGTAAAIGPPIGGFLTARYGWHSVFIVNLPVVLLSFLLEPPRAEARRARAAKFDVIGSALLGIAVLLLVAAVERGGALAIALAAIALIAFIARELRASDPVLDVRLFTRRAFAAGSTIVALQNLAMYSLLFLLPFFLARSGAAPSTTGRMLLLFTAAMVLASPLAGRASDAIGPRAVAVSGAILATTGAALFVAQGVTVASLILLGAGIGISTSPSQAAALSAIDAAQAGVASGALSTMRYVGGVIGSGLVALLAANAAANDARLLVFPLVLFTSALVALLLPSRYNISSSG